jgi:hypothetical protein
MVAKNTPDLTRLIEKLDPRPDGQDKVQLRTGVINEINADGTVDVILSGVVVPNVPRLASVSGAVGSVVQVQVYRGSMLVIGVSTPALMPTGALLGTPATSAVDGTATAANTTEVRDAVLGNYVFTAVAGHWYEICYSGALANVGTANCRMITRIRDGGNSTPTTGSTLVGETTNYCTETGTAGRNSILVCGRPRQFAAGVRTLSAFTQSPDSAAATPVVDTMATRMLFARYAGPVN